MYPDYPSQYPQQPQPTPVQPPYIPVSPQPTGYLYGPPPPPFTQTDGRATASMVLGIVSLVLSFCWGIGVITAIVGIALGGVALSQLRVSGKQGRGMALAGVWMNGIVLALVALGFVFFFLAAASSSV